MNNKQQIFNNLFHAVASNPTLAKQDICTDKLEPGMLCRTMNFEKTPELFYLLTEENDGIWEVIPGSLDGIMAGPDDIILPKNVMGDYVFLSLNLAASIPSSSIGKAFAMLDDATYNRVIDSQIKFETGEDGEQKSFAFALPYISKNDSRVAYHDEITAIVQAAQEPVFSTVFEESPEQSESFTVKLKEWFEADFSPVFDMPEVALAAGAAMAEPYAECSIEQMAGTIMLKYSPAEKSLFINCYDKNDDPDSVNFENWRVVESSGNVLSVIAQGEAVIRDLADFTGKICLVDTDNQIHKLIKKGE